MIYLDNNATTIMPETAIKAMMTWLNKGNPSAQYASALRCQALISEFRKYLLEALNINNSYRVIITSGASESNNTILRMFAEAFLITEKVRPHIITSAVEHNSIIKCAEYLQESRFADVTFVRCNDTGFVDVKSIEEAIRPNTCLISIMHANNETGAINDIDAISCIARRHKIPFHTDAVQSFGKIVLKGSIIDAISLSFHKLHGPPGIGALIIKESLINDKHLHALICGTQNEGMRGGTENISAIACALVGTKYTLVNRVKKTANILECKRYIMKTLSKYVNAVNIHDYVASDKLQIVFISGENQFLPNTLLLSFAQTITPHICNVKIKKYLEKEGIIVSIGSACNTSSDKASHVLVAIGADTAIKQGTIRISLGTSTTYDECVKFVGVLKNIIDDINQGGKKFTTT